jgi:hypothetical protein
MAKGTDGQMREARAEGQDEEHGKEGLHSAPSQIYGDYATLCPQQTFTQAGLLKSFPDSTAEPWTVVEEWGPTASGLEGITVVIPGAFSSVAARTPQLSSPRLGSPQLGPAVLRQLTVFFVIHRDGQGRHGLQGNLRLGAIVSDFVCQAREARRKFLGCGGAREGFCGGIEADDSLHTSTAT